MHNTVMPRTGLLKAKQGKCSREVGVTMTNQHITPSLLPSSFKKAIEIGGFMFMMQGHCVHRKKE
jgi:hypothetical protein